MFDLDAAKEISSEMIPLMREAQRSLDYVNEVIWDITKQQTDAYDDFVLGEFGRLGYKLSDLENQDCRKLINIIDMFTEDHHYFLNNKCILSIRQITSDEMNDAHVYSHKITFIKLGGIGKDGCES